MSQLSDRPKFTCPRCGGQETRVVDSRPLRREEGIRRRRRCLECSQRFTTVERAIVVEHGSPY